MGTHPNVMDKTNPTLRVATNSLRLVYNCSKNNLINKGQSEISVQDFDLSGTGKTQ